MPPLPPPRRWRRARPRPIPACAQLWTVPDLALHGVLQGHRRGVWAAEFSPVDRVLATASGDRTVRLWSVTDMSCLKSLEGHSASVLRVHFLRAGLQLASAGADGLLKLWEIRTSEVCGVRAQAPALVPPLLLRHLTPRAAAPLPPLRASQCVATLDAHEDKAWALAVRPDSAQIVSGGADSVLCVWRDCTAEAEAEAVAVEEEKVLKAQALSNAVRAEDYHKVRCCAARSCPSVRRGATPARACACPPPLCMRVPCTLPRPSLTRTRALPPTGRPSRCASSWISRCVCAPSSSA